MVRYERPNNPTPVGAFKLDVFDPSSRVARPIPVPLTSPPGLLPGPQVPVAPLIGDTLYLQMSLNGAMSLLPLSVKKGTVGPLVTVTEPASTQPVSDSAIPPDQGLTTIGALPGQGLVYRVKTHDTDSDDLIAVDPITGHSRRLTHIEKAGPSP